MHWYWIMTSVMHGSHLMKRTGGEGKSGSLQLLARSTWAGHRSSMTQYYMGPGGSLKQYSTFVGTHMKWKRNSNKSSVFWPVRTGFSNSTPKQVNSEYGWICRSPPERMPQTEGGVELSKLALRHGLRHNKSDVLFQNSRSMSSMRPILCN